MDCKYDGCNSKFGSEKYEGYCRGHAMMMGLTDPVPPKPKVITAADIYSRILDDRSFSLSEIIGEMRKDKAPLNEDIKKMLLIKWWFSDVENRDPLQLHEVAPLLEMPRYKLYELVESRWFSNKIKERLKTIDVLMAPYLQKVRNIKALGGDKDALTSFFKQTELQADHKEDNPFKDISAELEKEAKMTVQKSQKKESKTLYLDTEENSIYEDFTKEE